jgi:hypothetical protein
MDAEKPKAVRRTLLRLSVVPVGAFLFYVLSIGPVTYIAIRTGVRGDSAKRIGLFYAPVRWFMESTPLGWPLKKYWEWWAFHGTAHRNRSRN